MVCINPRRLTALIVVSIGATYFAGAADAATNPFGCRASAGAVRNSPLPAAEPFVANKALTPCATDSAGVSSSGVIGPNPTGGTVTAGPGGAFTFSSTSEDTSAGPVAPAATALADLNGGSIGSPGGAITFVGPAQAQVSYQCQNGAVVPSASSTLSAVVVDGTMVTTPQPGAEQTIPLPGGSSLTINEKLQSANSLTERLIDLHMPGAGDAVLGEVQVTQTGADPCAGTAGQTPGSVNACAPGSTLNPAADECQILNPGGAANGSTGGSIGVSRPFAGPTGGFVLALSVARKRFKSPCLWGAGPRFAVIGTNRANRIQGMRTADRILALGGNDRVAGRGGNDCIDGGSGNDRIFDANGNDRVFGGTGNDWIAIGNGRDTVLGGAGNDRIHVGRGRDQVFGGAGNDHLFGAGKVTLMNGGAGRDTAFVRAAGMRYARKHSCERVIMIGKRKR